MLRCSSKKVCLLSVCVQEIECWMFTCVNVFALSGIYWKRY